MSIAMLLCSPDGGYHPCIRTLVDIQCKMGAEQACSLRNSVLSPALLAPSEHSSQ